MNVFKCTFRAWMTNQMWLEQNIKYKKMFYAYEQRKKWQ